MKLLRLLFLVSLLFACDSADKPTLSLYLAVQRGDIDQIQRHIVWGADVNQLDVDGRQPLHVAALQGELVVIRLLLKNGADIDGLDRNGHSPLYIAVMGGKTQVADFLIEKGLLTMQTDCFSLLSQIMSSIGMSSDCWLHWEQTSTTWTVTATLL